MEHVDNKELDPTELVIDPVNERVSNVSPYSEDGESLQDSIEEMGVIQPIVVRKDGELYKVVAGQRRTHAAQAAKGVDTIPARVMEMDDTEARIVSITENAEQFDKNVRPNDRALAIQELRDAGLSTKEIADRMGTTQPTISRWLEPARKFWEDTQFQVDSEEAGDEDVGIEDISLEAMQTIRKNTSNKARAEQISKKVIQNNISNKLVKGAADRSNNPADFEKEIDQVRAELNSDVQRTREEVYFSGNDAERLENVMKDRGINEKRAIEALVKERLHQLERKDRDEWVGIPLDDGLGDALEEAIGKKDIQKRALSKILIKKKLENTGYL